MPKNKAGPGAPDPAPEDQGAVGKSTQRPGKPGRAGREERLAAALRENLRRRKAGGKRDDEDQEDRE